MAKKRILLVDDDSNITSLLKLYLEESGIYEVREENNAEQALAAAKAFRPDLIFLDMMMPNVLGGKIAYQLEEDEEFKDTPVVFLSGVLGEEDRVTGGTIARRPAVAKPVSPKEVMRLIEKHLPKKILFVHADKDFSKLLKFDIDQNTECKALAAASGEAGLKLVEMCNPDLVLLDITMPDMDGLETLKRIKAIAPDIPVAMVTAVYKEKEAKRYLDAGACDYITKPINAEYLRAALLGKSS